MMKTKKKLIPIISAALTLSVSTTVYASEFEGVYTVNGVAQEITVKKLSTDKFSVTSPSWDGVAFWDKEASAYEGVFRYNDGDNIEGEAFSTGGKHENAVGYHSFAVADNGTVTVTLQWGLSKQNGRHVFTMTKQEKPE